LNPGPTDYDSAALTLWNSKRLGGISRFSIEFQ
jgi:hypothetical protein